MCTACTCICTDMDVFIGVKLLNIFSSATEAMSNNRTKLEYCFWSHKIQFYTGKWFHQYRFAKSNIGITVVNMYNSSDVSLAPLKIRSQQVECNPIYIVIKNRT